MAAVRLLRVPPNKPSAYTHLIEQVLKDRKRFPTQQALATFLRVRGQTVSRVMRSGGHFGIEGSVRLAQAANKPPSLVLRLAGKRQREFADLLDLLYGGPSHVTPDVSELIDLWTRADVGAQKLVRGLLEYAAPGTATRHGATPGRPAAARTRRKSPKTSTANE